MTSLSPRGPRRILIIGGSMAGLFAGILLRRLGWQVDIYERAGEELASRGAGIATHAELYAAFRQAGVTLDRAMGVECAGRIALDRDGALLGELAMPQVFTSWGLLYRFLRKEFPDPCYHLGMSLSGFTQDRAGVTAEFADGSSERGEFLLGADGTRSRVRQLAFPEVEPRYVGYTAWRGLADEARLSSACLGTLAGRMAFCLPPREHALGYLVAGPGDRVAPGERWYNWVWYRPAPERTALRALLTDADGQYYPLGIPPPRIRPAHIDRVREAAARLLAPQFLEVVLVTAQPFLQPIHELESPRLIAGRAILLGDAAFTARPHIGLGVSKAAEDAARLAQVFAAPGGVTAAALQAWEAERLRFGRAVIRQSMRLGSYIGTRPAGAAARRAAEFYRRPETVMAQAAAAEPYRYLDL